MRLLLRAIAIVGCVTAASAAQAVPFTYDEGDSGDIFARIGAIPVFDFGVGNNVIAGSQFFSGPGFEIADADLFSFVVLPAPSGLYSWIDGLGFSVPRESDFSMAGARWDYRLTFGVESIAVPGPAPLALLGFGLLALFVRRAGARFLQQTPK